MGKVDYLALDEWNTILLWSDEKNREVLARRYEESPVEIFNNLQTAYKSQEQPGKVVNPFYAVGLVLDRGLGPPRWAGGHLDCFGHGRCLGFSGSFECSCDSGYFGNCALRSCPSGPAWFHDPAVDDMAHDEDKECSNMGVCDHSSGQCLCKPGFEGAACERMSCPGIVSTSLACSNAGRCVSLRDLGAYRSDELSEFSPRTYGSAPFNPKTWDADMIYGCRADDYGYYHPDSTSTVFSSTLDVGSVPAGSGYNLNERPCVRTHNFRTIETSIFNSSTNGSFVYNEQYLQCSATSGHFRLSFKNEKTSLIHHNDSMDSVAAALAALTTIGDISISVVRGGSTAAPVCDPAADTIVDVILLTELGLVPVIQVVDSEVSGGSISMYSVASDTSFLHECGGRGECHKPSGRCVCWDGWGSSDGFGGVGSFGDCGYNMIQ